jgi:predicted SnoaL-like aldol condensation-catalyzing enzyme
MCIISIPGQQGERTAGGRTKEIRNERIYGLKEITHLSSKPSRPARGGISSRVLTLFNRKDFAAAEKFWSPNYIQHSAHIPPGRAGLFGLVKSAPPEMKYENSLIVADSDMSMLHGRFSGLGLPANWILVDIVRIENGLLAEHWDVIEDEVTREKSASGLPMFGTAFPSR